MKKLAVVSLALLLLTVPMAACGGPMQVTRGLDDWVNQGYTDTPWLYGNVISHGLIGFATGITWMVDSLINIYYFWAKDAQPFGDGKGTTFTHKVVTPKK